MVMVMGGVLGRVDTSDSSHKSRCIKIERFIMAGWAHLKLLVSLLENLVRPQAPIASHPIILKLKPPFLNLTNLDYSRGDA